MKPVLIPEDHWIGSHCLNLGLPWLTPGAIRWLEEHVRPTNSVLEFGSGGSTVFFAARCKVVHSFDSSEEWIRRTTSELRRRTLEARFCELPSTEADVADQIERLLSADGLAGYDIALVDSDGELRRSAIAEIALSYLGPGGTLVIDNYYKRRGLVKSLSLPGWEVLTFNHPKWHGLGTMIARRQCEQLEGERRRTFSEQISLGAS